MLGRESASYMCDRRMNWGKRFMTSKILQRGKNMRNILKGLCLCALVLFVTLAALAQTETGQITGTVRDQSGAVIANAKVTVKSVTTGLTRQATSNGAG